MAKEEASARGQGRGLIREGDPRCQEAMNVGMVVQMRIRMRLGEMQNRLDG